MKINSVRLGNIVQDRLRPKTTTTAQSPAMQTMNIPSLLLRTPQFRPLPWTHSLRSRRIKGRGWGRRKRIWGRERLLQKPLLLHLRLLFYGNRINRAVSSMTNQNKARVFLHDCLYAGRGEKIFIAANIVRKSSSRIMSATPTKVCKSERKPKINIQKTAAADFVE